ncbi:hypothetical protein DUNSADRAFT_7415 [Dunaliella salina]|uniref:Uncharacterized protein n=1 Tax=Dunaliella salina TaxID=3046 RepID=A0ABQ7GLE9_DUNSA|nr:hypothetical protein DUNSADRAFT_7415 [Dunaliella salina]|eukprot:KAF5835427.1 hypothetical protein DUNSADRAFT_7415 [Dunaliella salina]
MRGNSSDLGLRQSSKKWSQKEVEQLLDAINAARCSDAKDINWAYVAIHVPTRTGKQCREKYKNDLRPDLSKSPWTGQEEYILARAHCEIGNLWAEIGQFLPGRSENTIKNKWNATLRAKADTKAHTLLWTYAQTWQAQNKNTSREVFEMAVREFCQQNGQACFDDVKVPDSYFQDAGLGGGLLSAPSEAGAAQGGSQPHRSGRAPNARQPSRKTQPRHGSRKRSRCAYDSEEEEEQEEEWSDSEDDGTRAAARRPHTKRSSTAIIQQQLRKQRQQEQQQQQQELQQHQERLGPSQLPTPACMPPNFPLPNILQFPAPPQPPPPLPSDTLISPSAQQQQQQQHAAFPPCAPALADITNLAHLSSLEPSATIKLCAPKHAQDSLKGFSFTSDAAPHAAPCQANQTGGSIGIQGGGELGQQQQGQDVQGSMGVLLQQQLQQHGTAVHTRTPGCKVGHAAAQFGSPTPVLGRVGLNPASYLSPTIPQVGADVDYLAYLREIGLESTNDYNHSPATLPLLKLLSSARRESGFDLGSGFGGSTVKTLPLFGNASRRDSLLPAGGAARRESWLISGGARKESLGPMGLGHASNRPSWLSKPSGPQPSDLTCDHPSTQPSDLTCDPPATQFTPRQHELHNQNPQEQRGQLHHPQLGVPDARQLLPELFSPRQREQHNQNPQEQQGRLHHPQLGVPDARQLLPELFTPRQREQHNQNPQEQQGRLHHPPLSVPDARQLLPELFTPRQHEQHTQNPQEQQGCLYHPQLGVPDAQQLLLELSLRALRQQQLPQLSPRAPQPQLPLFSPRAPQQQLPQLALHAPQQQLQELSPHAPQQLLPELSLRVPGDEQQDPSSHHPSDLQQPSQPMPPLQAALPMFGACHIKSAGDSVGGGSSGGGGGGEFAVLTQAARLAAASPRLAANSPTCGFVSGCFL